MEFIKPLRNRLRPYRNAYNVFRIQGWDIWKYIHRYVPAHKDMFEQLEKFRNIHRGKRCFIVATGPSLTIEDVEKLKGEICWTCNSGINLFDKTDWRPDYYAIADGRVFEKVKDRLDSEIFKASFFNEKDIRWKGTRLYPLPIQVSLVMDEETRRCVPRFMRKKQVSTNITKRVFMGDNITFIIMQICLYMGFSEIYLLGCDCNYKGADIHSEGLTYAEEDKLFESADYVGWSMIQDHKCMKKAVDRLGVRIFNATRGGMLEVYPRVNLDEVLGKTSK